MTWMYLAIAVIFEISVAFSASKAAGFKNAKWTAITLVTGAIGTFFLSLALLTFDVGVGYAIWTSVSGAGIVVIGALVLGQRLTWAKTVGIAAIIIGVAGLQLSGSL